MFDTQAKNIASNVTLLVISRLSMVAAFPALSIIGWLGGQWLDQRFTAQENQIKTQASIVENQSNILTSRIETVERSTAARIETVERTAGVAVEESSKVGGRLTIVETKQNQDAMSSEKFQSSAIQRLDRMQDSIVAMSNAVAALTATLQAERDKARPPN